MRRAASSVVALAGLMLLLGTRPAAAGDLTIALEGGYSELTSASESAHALFDSAGGLTGGASIRFGLRDDKLFLGLGGRFFRKQGERAFVAEPGGPVFRLGHPLTLRLLPVEIQGGWRFRPESTLRPYAGLAGGVALIEEKSTVGGVTESETASKFTGRALLGLDWSRGAARLGVEASWTIVPGALGDAGVSAVYGESDAGGLLVLLRVGWSL